MEHLIVIETDREVDSVELVEMIQDSLGRKLLHQWGISACYVAEDPEPYDRKDGAA